MFNINSLAVKQISFKNFSRRRSNVIDAITIKSWTSTVGREKRIRIILILFNYMDFRKLPLFPQ